MLCATSPASPSCAESAMVKQPACAAAINSSGLVPTPFSKRVLKEYCVCFSVPLSVEIEPLPVFRSPCHTALALRCIEIAPFSCFIHFECGEFDSLTHSKGILRMRLSDGARQPAR